MIVLYVYTNHPTQYCLDADAGASGYKVERLTKGHFDAEFRILLNRAQGELLTVVACGSETNDAALIVKELWPPTIWVEGGSKTGWFEKCLDLPARKIRDRRRLMRRALEVA